MFLLPEYLEEVQNYSSSQTGEAMVLIGLPQLLIFPLVPRLMKALDLRLIVFAGSRCVDQRQTAWQELLRQIFTRVDFIALPTLQKLPTSIPTLALFETQMLNLQNTVPVNFAENPALAIPIPLDDKIFAATSLQLVGPWLS